MKAAYTREIINPILPCKMEGYNEARFCFNQTAQQKQVSGEGLRTACGLRDDLLLDTLILQAGETMVFFTLDIAIAEQQFTDAWPQGGQRSLRLGRVAYLRQLFA